VKEQVKSGLLIAGKLVAAFCIAAVFLSGCALVREPGSSSEILIGLLLVALSIAVMTVTVKFWVAGFVGFIAYAALRCVAGSLFVSSSHVLLMLSLGASFLAMSVLGVHSASNKRQISEIDRAALVVAATCALLAFVMMDSYKSVAILNVGNIGMLFSWWVSRGKNSRAEDPQQRGAG